MRCEWGIEFTDPSAFTYVPRGSYALFEYVISCIYVVFNFCLITVYKCLVNCMINDDIRNNLCLMIMTLKLFCKILLGNSIGDSVYVRIEKYLGYVQKVLFCHCLFRRITLLFYLVTVKYLDNFQEIRQVSFHYGEGDLLLVTVEIIQLRSKLFSECSLLIALLIYSRRFEYSEKSGNQLDEIKTFFNLPDRYISFKTYPSFK